MEKQMPKIEGEPYTPQPWPSMCTGPDGERQVFDSEAEVPNGWTHHGKTKGSKAPPPPPPAAGKAPPPPPPGAAAAGQGEAQPGDLDAAGVKLDLFRHTGTLTKSGLWRMKVGVARPDEEGENSPNYVKPVPLDL